MSGYSRKCELSGSGRAGGSGKAERDSAGPAHQHDASVGHQAPSARKSVLTFEGVSDTLDKGFQGHVAKLSELVNRRLRGPK